MCSRLKLRCQTILSQTHTLYSYFGRYNFLHGWDVPTILCGLWNTIPQTASGRDQIRPLILKMLSTYPSCTNPPTHLWSIVHHGQCTQWMEKTEHYAHLQEGSLSNPSNYRPASLICLTCKLTEHSRPFSPATWWYAFQVTIWSIP